MIAGILQGVTLFALLGGMVMSHPALAQPAPDNAIEISVGIDNAKRSIKPGGGLDESRESCRDCPECPQMGAVLRRTS